MYSKEEKLNLLSLVKKGTPVKQVCSHFNVSRSSFYKWKKQYEEVGIDGLEIKPHRKPQMPNQVNKATEKAILEQVAKTPKDGPRQIAYMLSLQGYTVGETGVYRVLRRHGLSKRAERFTYVNNIARHRNSVRELSTLDIKLKKNQNQRPGYLIMETLGKLPQTPYHEPCFYYAIYDVYSKWGLIELYPTLRQVDIAKLYHYKIMPLTRTFKLPIENILSYHEEGYKEHFDKRWQVIASDTSECVKIKVWELPKDRCQLIKPLDDFTRVIFEDLGRRLEESLPPEVLEKKTSDFDTLQEQLSSCLSHYNFKKFEKTYNPSEVLLSHAKEKGIDLEALPLWVYMRMMS